MYCNKCRAELPETARFCESCGVEQTAEGASVGAADRAADSSGTSHLNYGRIALFALVAAALVLVGVGIGFILAGRSSVPVAEVASPDAPSMETTTSIEQPRVVDNDPLGDGIHVEGLYLYPGVSQSAVLAALGTENERWGGVDGIVTYGWDLPDGSSLSVDFGPVGEVRAVRLYAPDSGAATGYAALDGKKVTPGKDTLRSAMKIMPDGFLDDPMSMEGAEWLDYRQIWGGEGCQTMTLTVSWSWDNVPADPEKMPLSSVSFD